MMKPVLVSILFLFFGVHSVPLQNRHGHKSIFPRNPSLLHNHHVQDIINHDKTLKQELSNEIDFPRGGDASETPKILAPAIFGSFALALINLLYKMDDLSLPTSFAVKALNFVIGAVSWDNLIICIGSIFFSDAATDKVKYGMLKVLSYPRFIFHAVGVPFLLVTTAAIGEAAGISWLQHHLIQFVIFIISTAIAVVSRLRFKNSPGIDLETFEDSPPNALERDLTVFTYKESSFLYVVPSILLTVANIIVGIGALKTDNRDVGIWLILSAIAVLVGSAQKPHIMRFTGNLGEVLLLAGYVKAGSLLSAK